MDSSSSVLLKEEGLGLFKSGLLDNAIEKLNQAKSINPEDPQIHAYLGAAYIKKGDKLNAVFAFEEALRLEETPKAYYNLALAYEQTNRIDKAVQEYRIALELDPNYAAAQAALNRIQQKYQSARIASDPASHIQSPSNLNTTQAMSPQNPNQTQAFAGPPVGGPPPGGVPYDEEIQRSIRKAIDEKGVKELQKRMIKSGIIYGAICGAIMMPLMKFASMMFFGSMPNFIAHGYGIFLYILILMVVGAIYGSLIGAWVGYSGQEEAGRNAGLMLGAVAGLAQSAMTGNIIVIIFCMVVFAIFSAIAGSIIGKMVENSIN